MPLPLPPMLARLFSNEPKSVINTAPWQQWFQELYKTMNDTINSAGVSSVNTRTGAVVLSKTDVGLGNADNTSDANKPISTATQNALDDKADLNGSNLVVQNPANATATPTASKIPIADGAGDLDKGWIPEQLGSHKFGDPTNYSQFETDGTLSFHGDATIWDDVYPSSVTVGTTGPNIPTFSTYNGNLRAYDFVGVGAIVKELHLGFQFYHSYKEGTGIVPHIHLFIPDNVAGGVIRFGLEYTWTNVSETGAVATSTIYGTVTRAPNAGISNNHILSFGAVSGTGKTLSSILMARLFRDPSDVADTFGASVWLKSADIHIIKDTVGSRQELVK